MKTTISEKIKTDAMLRDSVEQATNLLDVVMGNPPNLAEADWRFDVDFKGRPYLTLTVNDWGGETSTRFTPDELSKPYHLYSRLQTVYSNLLRNRTDRQLQKLDQSIKEVVGEV